MDNINYIKAKEELERKNLYQFQKELVISRKTRTITMSVLIAGLLLTIIYGMLENPLIYTLSQIGNRFPHRVAFICWSIIAGGSIQFAVIMLFKLENYETKYGYLFVGLSTGFLIITAIIPALGEVYPFWLVVHTITSGLCAFFLFLSLVPFSTWISQENPRLRKNISIWTIVIYAGSVSMLVFFSKSGMFELFFFVSNILYLLYLSLVLFEEDIIKKSVKLLVNEENLNEAIEKIFVDLEIRTEKQDKEMKKKSLKESNKLKS